MSRPYWSIRHVESMERLPERLERGRAYFVDDEQVIVIDHGNGPVTYGGKPGPQGQTGEPIPQLQDQINDLAEAVLITQKNIWDEGVKYREDIVTVRETTDEKIGKVKEETDEKIDKVKENISLIENNISDSVDFLRASSNENAEAILQLISTINSKFNDYDNAISTLAKTIAGIYEPGENDNSPDRSDELDGEILTTDAGSWVVQQTKLKDGTIVIELEAEELFIDTLKLGDKVDYDGSTWTVADYEKSGDTITMTLSV